MRKALRIAILGTGALGAPAMAQSNIDPLNKYCWQENSGWMNWRDANGGADGARDRMTYLSGFVWSESLGWINLGGTPANGVHFANATSEDFGVNVAEDGLLSGFAWCENAGWINFSGGAMAKPAKPARISDIDQRLYGFAWGENFGWINLDLSVEEQFVERLCFANCDGSSIAPVLTANDFQCFLDQYAAHDPAANCDRSAGNPLLTPNDFQCFLDAFSRGCH